MTDNKYLHYNILLMLFVGTFKLQTQSTFQKKLFRIWRIFIFANLMFVLVAVSIDLHQKGTNHFDAVVMNFVYISGAIIMCLRASYYYIFDNKSEDILKEVRRLFKYQTKTLLEEKNLKKCIDLGMKLTITWLALGTFVTQGYILVVIIFNASLERKLPLPLWFPYNWKVTPLYELTILYQVFIHQIMVIIVISTDMFYATVIMLTSEQFNLLGWEVKNLLYTILLKNNVGEEVFNSIQTFINSKSQKLCQGDIVANELLQVQKIRKSLVDDLKQLIRLHQELLKFCDRIENFFSPMYLPYLFMILVVDVFMCFIVTTTNEVTLMLTIGLFMTSVTITQLLACYFGHLLAMQAEAFQNEVYDSPWYICDEVFKSHFKFLHLKTCKPIILTVGKIAPLSLNAFLWFSRTLITYVTVLYQLTEENR